MSGRRARSEWVQRERVDSVGRSDWVEVSGSEVTRSAVWGDVFVRRLLNFGARLDVSGVDVSGVDVDVTSPKVSGSGAWTEST